MDPDASDSPRVAAAVASLREHVDQRWVEISDSILARVLSRSRPSHPVVGVAPGGMFHVSEAVLRRLLLDAMDAVDSVAVSGVDVHTEDSQYTGVTVVIAAQYGLALLPAADQIREVCRQRLVEVLGEAVPVEVRTMRVHVEDVTPDDPKQG